MVGPGERQEGPAGAGAGAGLPWSASSQLPAACRVLAGSFRFGRQLHGQKCLHTARWWTNYSASQCPVPQCRLGIAHLWECDPVVAIDVLCCTAGGQPQPSAVTLPISQPLLASYYLSTLRRHWWAGNALHRAATANQHYTRSWVLPAVELPQPPSALVQHWSRPAGPVSSTLTS